MQIFLKFRGRDIYLPMANKYQLQSLIYQMLSPAGGYTDFLHNEGYQVGRKIFRLFTFGDLYGRYEIRDRRLYYGDRFSIRLRSPQLDFVTMLLKNISCGDQFELCGNWVMLEDIVLEDRRITASEITVKTLSPITVYTTTSDRKTRYFSPGEPEFAEAVRVNALDKSRSLPGLAGGNFAITPFGSFTERNKVVTRYKGLYITAWHGTFVLEGEPALLDFLYNTGLGAKNAQGFGMFDVIDER